MSDTAAPATDAPYAGYGLDGRQARPGPHVLVLGPSGVGKTLRVLAPAIGQWGGPAISVSSKADLAQTVIPARRRSGPQRVLDLGGHVDLPDDVDRVRFDPTLALTSPDDALDLAALLLRVGTVGAGRGSGEAFWTTLATPPLAALLWHAALSGDGVAGAVMVADDLASWEAVIGDLRKHPAPGTARLAKRLLAVAGMEARMQSSILATMQPALAAWMRDSIAPADAEPPLDIATLEAGTLHIVSPGEGVAAAAACALLAQVVWAWRRATEQQKPRKTLLIAADEIANTAPLPHLPIWVTEARGLGVRIIAATQTTAQLAARWGEAEGRVLSAAFPSTLVLTGSPDHRLLEQAAVYAGQVERGEVTTGADGRASGHRRTEAAAIRPEALAPTAPDYGRLLNGGRDAGLVRLPGWWEMTRPRTES